MKFSDVTQSLLTIFMIYELTIPTGASVLCPSKTYDHRNMSTDGMWSQETVNTIVTSVDVTL